VPRIVDFYFDYSSPFAYLASTQIERVAGEAGGSVVYKPFLLGALFKAIGAPNVPLLAMPEVKQRYQRLELARWAAHWGVPFRWTTHFPLRTVDALRMTIVSKNDPALIAKLMRAAWADDLDLGDRAVLASIAPELVDRTHEAKDALRAATDEAIAVGCPGAPCFVVDGELYWGQDRLMFVKAALES
jgi:2-hydroxychromene-2-carboxylate isomerase